MTVTVAGHRARKRFGQNFLVDAGVVAAIVNAIDPQPDDHLVEIGPGQGALTAPLLKRVAHLDAIELDRDLCAILARRFLPQQLTLHSGDALEFDFSTLGDDLRVLGNLPYNVSTPLLFHLAGFTAHCRDLHFMLQREVVERMVAATSTPEYGRLSVMLQDRFDIEMLFEVPPESFRPAPKVTSAVVRLRPLRPAERVERGSASDPTVFAQVVSSAFTMRRKTLRNALASMISAADIEALGIDAGLRPENLSPRQFAAIADRCAAVRAAQG
jgi:16S rRNA (adenine1518-N6/adenine1519-N6)-dimethyltransferase